MDVAYDKLGLKRPASEPVPSLGTWTDQPLLDLMTQKPSTSSPNGPLSSAPPSPSSSWSKARPSTSSLIPTRRRGRFGTPSNSIKAVGVGRAWAAKRAVKDTLIVVTADHDQSMSIIGISNTPIPSSSAPPKNQKLAWTSAAGAQDATVYGDSYSNVRAGLPFINASTTAGNNGGASGQPGTFAPVAPADKPETSTYSTYYGNPAYKLDSKTGYPVNEGAGLRRLAVGYRTGDHTGSSVPVTAEGPGALIFNGYMDESDLFFKMAATLSNDTTDIDKAPGYPDRRRQRVPEDYRQAMIGRISIAAAITAAFLVAQMPGAVDPQIDSAGFHWFRLGESKAEVARLLGPPKISSPVGNGFDGWQFQIGETEEGEFSHHAVFRTADGKLVSMAVTTRTDRRGSILSFL